MGPFIHECTSYHLATVDEQRLLSDSAEGWESESKALAGDSLPEAWWWAAVLGAPWLSEAARPAPPALHGPLPGVCISVSKFPSSCNDAVTRLEPPPPSTVTSLYLDHIYKDPLSK